MWNATYAELIATDPTRTKFYKGEQFGEITLPQSLIYIKDKGWCLEKPRNRTAEEKRDFPDRERFLVPIMDVNAQIIPTPLTENPYTLFKKGKTIETPEQLQNMTELYQESVAAIQEVDGRPAVWQIRQKRNAKQKIELVDRNLQQDGFTMDLFTYYARLAISKNPYLALAQRLILAYKALLLLHALHTKKKPYSW